jgi:DNA-binding response OmpR family regulator
MSALEFSVMHYLIIRRGDAVSRERLLNDVWGSKSFPTTRSVDNLIVRLRHKLETGPCDPNHLVTVHGVVYKFVD